MEQNLGTADRIIRATIGLLLLNRLRKPGKWRWLGLIGIMPLRTAITGRCAAYEPLGINTAAKS